MHQGRRVRGVRLELRASVDLRELLEELEMQET